MILYDQRFIETNSYSCDDDFDIKCTLNGNQT